MYSTCTTEMSLERLATLMPAIFHFLGPNAYSESRNATAEVNNEQNTKENQFTTSQCPIIDAMRCKAAQRVNYRTLCSCELIFFSVLFVVYFRCCINATHCIGVRAKKIIDAMRRLATH